MSLYSVAHRVQAGMPWLWDVVEWGNTSVFVLQHRKALRAIPQLLEKYSDSFTVSEVKAKDCEKLAVFFKEQPEEAFKFFKPHEFDTKSLEKLARRKSFLMFKVSNGEDIVGYFFLRCFANSKAFRGKIVDYRWRNQGIAKLMGVVAMDVVMALNMRLFTTISPENYSSLASAKAVNDVRIVQTLENGYYYIECTPKNANGGHDF